MKGLKLLKVCFAIVIISFGIISFQANPVYPQFAEKLMNEDFEQASTIEDYKQFIEIYKPNEMAFVAVQRLAKPYLDEKDWVGAITVFQDYKEYFPGMKERFDKITELLNAPEKNLIVKNLGPNINSEKSEFRPIISVDGKKLYFGRNNGIFSGNEDIYVSSLTNSQWIEAEKLGPPLHSKSSETPIGISADGNTLTLLGNYPDSYGRGDNFFTNKTENGWSDVKHFPEPINSEYFDSGANLTADGKAVLFYSDRPGGVGNFHKKSQFFHGGYWGNIDIYVCVKTDSGWSEAINLGETINTPYCEYSPFLHPDGKTLYFSSNGHYGLGELDVFKATRLSDTSWTEWSEPINLGKEVNGSDNDWGYRISTSGDLAYFSAYNKPDGYGSGDLYSIELPSEAKPLAVTTVSGKVSDPNGNPLDVGIKWNDLTMNKEAGEAGSDPQTGDYFIALPAGHKYSYYAEKQGYIGKSEHLDLTDKEQYSEYTLDIILYPVEEVKKGEIAIQLNNIFFDVDKWELRGESFLELDRWVDFLNENDDTGAEIHGHTDNTGTEQHNKILSEKRAQSVVNYLQSKGIEKTRLTAKGFGEEFPVATNMTDEGRQKNRRVEIKLAQLAEAK